MDLRDADKAAKALKKTLDKNSRAHGGRSSGDIIDTESIEYFVLRDLIEGYTALRELQVGMKKVLVAINEVGKTIDWCDLDSK